MKPRISGSKQEFTPGGEDDSINKAEKDTSCYGLNTSAQSMCIIF